MPATCDVVVVGGGIAGVSVGYELAATHRVVLVEAERMLATHATGRSAAVYLPSYGTPTVRALTGASGPRFAELGRRFEVSPLLTRRPVLWVGFDEPGAAEVVAMVAERAGGPGALRALTQAEAVDVCPALRVGALTAAALDPASRDVDAMSLHHGYVRGLRARGGIVLAGTPAIALARCGDGWRVNAGDLVLDCGLVVDAAGAWADAVAGLAGVPPLGLQPRRRTLFVSPVPAELPWDPRGALVAETTERFYFKPEGRTVLASPADAEPCGPGDARPHEPEIARAIESINAVTRLDLRTVRRSWAGLRTFSPTGDPVVGVHSDHPGFAFLAGQGGYGIQMAPALAAFAAAVLTGAAVPEDIPLAPDALVPGGAGPKFRTPPLR
ncbi:MAG TPA: FAD-binding oxidoreductase [Actinophytocola sp.]|uniref:NAD(P)/FAD-dependent oxidoreductase n=1 Tax=Actinophytocola sp. TaxID=1872138 RepID=UPI002DBA3AB8|nr:FAD-binding oxidoreductase [Actinophytocola sp.]HEU5469560.1 FAD-binding oxidoreductase [Actinophytocola sp.]